MATVKTDIYIQQVPTQAFPARNQLLYANFVCEFEADDNWEDLANQGKITLPKKISYVDENGKKINLANIPANLGGFSSNPPTFLRGDRVVIMSGYRYRYKGIEKVDTAPMFLGFISKVCSKTTFTLELMDNMWKLQQAPAMGGVNGVFSWNKYDVEDILRELLANAGLKQFTVNALTKTNLGIDFRIDNGSICQVIEKLRKEHYLRAYFRGNELRCGSIVYIADEAITHTFIFQENIIDDDLDYRRKDDIVLSAIAKSTNKIAKQVMTKDGNIKTKTEKLEVLITYQNGTFTSAIKQPGSRLEFPPNNLGERHEFFYNNITDPQALITEAKRELQKYYYTGFRGKFTTFGVPFVKQGDNVYLQNKVLPEQDGVYKVKAVNYKGGMEGVRQTITVDYKLILNAA